MKRSILLIVPFVSSAFVAAAGAAEPVSVKVTQVKETRTKTLEGESPMSVFDGLSVTLLVKGDAVRNALKYGMLKLADAKFDSGDALKRKQSFGGDSDFESIQSPMQFGPNGEEKKEKDKAEFPLTLEFKVSPRKATKIAALKGEFQVLAGGTEKIIEVRKPADMLGKAIDDPALKDAKLDITIVKPKKGGMFGGDDGITLSFKGNADSIKDVEWLDGENESRSMGSMTTREGETVTTNYMLNGKPADVAVLKIHVMVGQKKVTVPFDLKDIELP